MRRKKSAKRMHTEDARFLRDLLLHVLECVNEIDAAVGVLQRPAEGSAEQVEVVES